MKNIILTGKLLLLSCLCSVLLLFLLTFACYHWYLTDGQIRGCVIAVYLISAMLGGWMAGFAMEGRRILCGLLLGAVYFFLLFLLSVCFQAEGIGGAPEILTAAAICAGGGMLGGILSPVTKKR